MFLIRIAVFLSLLTALNAQKSKLILVQMVIRHAERAPMHEFTSESSSRFFPRGLGEISDMGIARAVELGRSFRRRYRVIGLLKDNTTNNEVFIRSSPVTRSLLSAVSFSNSFLDKSNHSMPVIHTSASEFDEQVLVIIESPVFRCKILAKHNISDPLCRSSLLKETIVSGYPACSNFTYNNIEAALAEMEQPTVRINDDLRKCARHHGRKIAYKASITVPGVGSEFDESRARESIGPLMAIISRNIDEAHDHVILALSQALGIISKFEDKSPEFSSAIIIEMWRSKSGTYIKALKRIIMKNGIKSRFNDVSRMSKSRFDRRISRFVERDNDKVQWDESLTEIYSSDQYHEDLQATPI